MRLLVAASLALALAFTGCSSGKDRLEAIGVQVTERITDVKGEFGVDSVNLRFVTVPKTTNLDDFFDVAPSVRDLRIMTIQGHELSCDDLKRVAAMTDLLTLTFENCVFEDGCLDQLAALKVMEGFSIVGSPVTNDDLAFLAELPRMSRVVLNETAVDDGIVGVLAKPPVLQEVFLAGTNITDGFLAEAAKIVRLRQLSVNNTAVTDEALPLLATVSGLERLHAIHLGFGPGVESLAESAGLLQGVVLGVSDKEASVLSKRLEKTVLPPERAHEKID